MISFYLPLLSSVNHCLSGLFSIDQQRLVIRAYKEQNMPGLKGNQNSNRSYNIPCKISFEWLLWGKVKGKIFENFKIYFLKL